MIVFHRLPFPLNKKRPNHPQVLIQRAKTIFKKVTHEFIEFNFVKSDVYYYLQLLLDSHVFCIHIHLVFEPQRLA